MSDASPRLPRLRLAKATSPARFWMAIVGLGLGFIAFYVLLEAILAPWARSLVGDSTLTGEWQGEMTLPTGTTHLVWIAITRPLTTGSCYNCPSMEGRIATCHTAKIRDYDMWGSALTWGGETFELKAREAERGEVRLLQLDGTWDGADEIKLTTTLVAPDVPRTLRSEIGPDGQIVESVIGGHPDTRAPITFSMARGTRRDFETRCRAGSL
jgi:hypothetical protein